MTKGQSRRTIVIVAEDDPDDRFLIKEAFHEASSQPIEVEFVQDGTEIMDYLHKRGRYESIAKEELPELVVLDLNMPRMGGMEVLAEIKGDPALRAIPVVVLTTSRSPEHVARSYELGGNGFITKPNSYTDLVKLLGNLERYWFGTVSLP